MSRWATGGWNGLGVPQVMCDMSGSTVMAWLGIAGCVLGSRLSVSMPLLTCWSRACPAAEAARVLAGRFGVSARQARRYADQARASGRAEVPEASVVFTVKLPAALAGRVRAHARESGTTISAVVARALTEFLARGRRNSPRR